MRSIPYVLVLLILVTSGAITGIWTRRWETPPELAARNLASIGLVPETIGDWTGLSQQLDPRVMEIAEIDGYLMRRYVNDRGDAVSVLLVCGRPGPISVHTPDICYAGIGYEPVGGRRLLLRRIQNGRQ